MAELQQRVRGHDPGQTLEITLKRKGKELKKTVRLSSPSVVISMVDHSARQQRLGGALSTRISGFPEILQHDTVLRPRDIGGPIVNLDGKVVGINIARAGRIKSYALPADVIRKMIVPLKAGKYKVDAKKK